MFTVQAVETLEHPELLPYRTMKQQVDHYQQRIFVAEGEKVVRRLLESSFTVVSLLLPEKWLRIYEPLLEQRPEEIHAFVAEKAQLEKLTGFSMYQGVMAVAKVPPPVPLEIALGMSARPYLLVAVDGITNAQNLGVLVRNCGAFGVQAFLVGETSSSPFLRRAVRNSMGVIFHLPIVDVTNLAQTLRELRERGVQSVAAHPHAEGKTPVQVDFTADCCVVFGSEGYGLAPGVLEACSDAAAIPMQCGVDSLNVGSAAAAFLYEVNRQRGRLGAEK